YSLLMGFLFTSVVLGYQGPALGQSNQLEKLYEKARKEGEVVMATGVPPVALKAMENAFNQRFPGVKAKVIASTGSKAISRILMESKVGTPTIEVAQTTTSGIQLLLKADLVASYDYSAAFGIPKKGILYGNRLIPWFTLAYVPAYNTKLVSEDQAPTTWEGLLDPRWKGRKIILDGRGHPFQYLVHVWGREKVMEFVRKLKGQQPIFRPRGGAQIIEAVVAGQAPLGTAHLNRVLWARRKGDVPIDYVWLDYTPLINFYAYAVKNGAHPNAAKLMAGWLGTPEALKVYEDTSLRGLISTDAPTKTARLFRQARTKPAWSSVNADVAKKERKWQKEARRIWVGQ
ncbi:MAG: ABC transporter substrate-binding protein, partial [Candidatus Binatia bacterium]